MHNITSLSVAKLSHSLMAACYSTNKRPLLLVHRTLRSLIAISILTLVGCDFGNFHLKLNNDYVIGAIDTKSTTALFYSHNEKLVGVVEKRVIAYILEDNFIAVIRQHSSNGNGIEKDYYFVPLTEPFVTDFGETNVTGPLSLQEVTSMGVERGASDPLIFTYLEK